MSEMNREMQREVGALKLATDASRADNASTLVNTIHCAADAIEYLVLEGGDTYRDYTARERRRMATEGRAMPDGSYPIVTASDCEIAVRAIGRASDQAATRAYLRRRIVALGCKGSPFDAFVA